MAREGRTEMPGMKTVVISSILRQSDYSGVTVVGSEYRVFFPPCAMNPAKTFGFSAAALFRKSFGGRTS